MTGEELRRLREKHEWSQGDLAETLNGALGRRYASGTVSDWEREKRKVPAHVGAFLEALSLEENVSSLSQAAPSSPLSGARQADSAPGDGPDGFGANLPISTRGIYTKACTELWGLVAMAIGSVGAVVGSETLMVDGKIISADADALGVAYGKLAETNETFRKMLDGMTGGGAWLEVSLVTGITFGKLWNNHATHPELNGALHGVPGADPDAAMADPDAA